MSANYYFLHANGERQHVGKMSSRGQGQGLLFTWAVRPCDVMLLMLLGEPFPKVEASGKPVEFAHFVVELSLLSTEQEYSQIGDEFR